MTLQTLTDNKMYVNNTTIEYKKANLSNIKKWNNIYHDIFINNAETDPIAIHNTLWKAVKFNKIQKCNNNV